jgi:hypothetical protein
MIFLIPAREEDYQSPTVRFGIALVGVLLIVSTPFAAHSSYRVYQEARQSERWPTSDGEITRSEVEERKEDLTKTVYWPKVQYRYTVAERVYEGTRVNFDESGSQYSGRIESLVKRFPLGAKVPVYYDPADPAQAVLDPGLSFVCAAKSLRPKETKPTPSNETAADSPRFRR